MLAGSLPVSSTKGLTANPSTRKLGKHADAKDLVEKLLQVKPEDRLTGAQIKQHPWFSDIDWDKAEKRGLTPPYQPDCSQANCSVGTLDVMNQLGADTTVIPKVAAEKHVLFADYHHSIVIGTDGTTAHPRGSDTDSTDADSADTPKQEGLPRVTENTELLPGAEA
jgi:serine/threonine protein kinase